MRNKIVFLGLILLPIICYSFKQYDNKKDFDNEVPQPTTGVQIVPLSMMSGDESVKRHDLLKIKQMKEFGYINSDSPNAMNLMSIKGHAKQEIEEYKNSSDPYDTHLKKNVADIKLAFIYKRPRSITSFESLGVAPAGAWKDGWTSIVDFFYSNDFGVCSYTIYNLKLTDMGIKINSNAVTYVVNNKPTTFEIEGSKKSGFRYIIGWTDNTYDHNLACAKMDFDINQIGNMIMLSNKIDSE